MRTQPQSAASMQVFTLPAAALTTWHTLSTLAGHYPLVPVAQDETREHLVLYFDTADYRLLRTGFAVYVTQESEQAFFTVADWAVGLTGKVEKQIRQRMTVTAPIANPDMMTALKTWPKALRKAVAPALTGHANLQPIFLVQRQRTTRMIAAPSADSKGAQMSATALATLQLDKVTIWRPRAEKSCLALPAPAAAITQLGQLTVAFAAEETPAATAPDQLAADQELITTWLANQPGLQPVATTHQPLLEQALLAASRYAPGMTDVVGLQPSMLVADGCRLIWHEQLMVMLLNEAGVRYSQDREYVHEMRVAIRRARAAAKLYGHFLPRSLIRPYLATLRKTGRLLGHIRNLDVALTKARRARTQDGKAGQAPQKLLKAWRRRRHAALQKLIHWLDSSEYSDFLAAFQQFCATPEAYCKRHAIPLATPVPQQIRHVIPTQILEGYAAVRCYETLFAAALPVDAATLHELRIASKYLRYNLEFARHLLGPECETLITCLKALQELLGDLNDAVVAQRLVEEAGHGADVTAYQQAQATLVTELSKRVPTALAELVDQQRRTQLAQAVARL